MAKVVWALVLLVVGGVVGAAGYVVVTNPDILDLAAASPTRRPAAIASAVPRPSPSGPAAVVTETPRPVAPEGPSDPAARFAAIANDPNMSLRLEADASVRMGVVQMRMSMTLQQAGRDFALDMRIRMNGRTAAVKVTVKDGVAYSRVARGPWTRVGDPALLDVPNTAFGFSQLKVNEAVLVRTERRRGKELHLLRVPSTVATGVDPAEIRRLGCDTDDLSIDVWVRSDGTPVSAEFDYTCEARGEKMVLSATYEFSKVGRPVEVRVPPKFR